MITLEFSFRGGFAGRLVQIGTWSWCSHVDFVLPDGKLLGAVPDGGVSIRDWTPAQRIERYQVDAPADVFRTAASQIGKPYDWKGVIGLAFHRDWQDEGQWWCSEFVEWALERHDAGLVHSGHLHRVTPAQLLLSVRLSEPLPAVA